MRRARRRQARAGLDHDLAGRALGGPGQRAREPVEPDRRAGEARASPRRRRRAARGPRRPRPGCGGSCRGRRARRSAAGRWGGRRRRPPRSRPTSTTVPPGAAASTAARHASGPADRLEHQRRGAPSASTARAPSASAWARRSGWRSATVTVAAGEHEQPREHEAHRPAAEHAGVGAPRRRAPRRAPPPRAARPSPRPAGSRPSGIACSAAAGAAMRSAKAAEHPARRAADLRPPGPAGRAPPARHGVGHEHALAGVLARPGRLVPEGHGYAGSTGMAAAEHLHVGAARRRGVHAHDDLALRVGHLLHAQVVRARRAAPPSRHHDRLERLPAARHLQRARRPRRGPARCDTSGAGIDAAGGEQVERRADVAAGRPSRTPSRPSSR